MEVNSQLILVHLSQGQGP